MLAPLRYRIDEHGVTHAPSNPHLMFWPEPADADIGAQPRRVHQPRRAGRHDDRPVGEKERAAIAAESQALVEQVERTLGYQPSR